MVVFWKDVSLALFAHDRVYIHISGHEHDANKCRLVLVIIESRLLAGHVS
jgi:hypothetical protein